MEIPVHKSKYILNDIKFVWTPRRKVSCATSPRWSRCTRTRAARTGDRRRGQEDAGAHAGFDCRHTTLKDGVVADLEITETLWGIMQ
jgi:hypothetical protein